MIRILINTGIGVGLILIWAKFTNLPEVLNILKTTEIKFTFLFIFFFALSTLIRSFRLNMLLGKHKLPFKDVAMLNFLSQFLSFAIPIRAGEVTKGVYLTTQLDVSLSKAIIWVFADRFIDFWAVLLLISTLIWLLPTNLPVNLTQIIPVLFVILTIAATFAIKSRLFAQKVATFLSHLLVIDSIKRRFVSVAHNIIDGLEVLDLPAKTLFALVILTVLAFISDGFIWFFVFSALGFNLGIIQGVLGNALAALTFLIPAAPGFVGSTEASGLAVFGGILGVDANLASAASVLFHILVAASLVGFGVTSIYLLKFDLRLVWKKIRGQ